MNSLLNVEHISFLFVFFEGLLSFFSPCVLPLIPIYMSYLAGNTSATKEDGTISYDQKRVLFHTIFFIVGISTAFFLLGLSFTALGSFFKDNQTLFTRVGGILIIVLGLVQVGFLDIHFLKRERKLPFKMNVLKMNPGIAFLMGFTFSFAWTPCVGPALSSVLIMASGSKTVFVGNLLVLLYAAGFVIPFLLLGIFTTSALNFLKKNKKLMKYTVKVGGILLILIGIMTFTGWMNGDTNYLNRFTFTAYTNNNGDTSIPSVTPPTSTTSPTTTPETDTSESAADEKAIPAFDFTLLDQYGNEHTLSDYKGKVVFLNFWATWCPPCQNEMPYIEELYQEYGMNKENVIFLGVANPSTEENPNNNDVSQEEVTKFLKDNNYTFPVVYDLTGDVLRDYYISAFPTTFMIDADGNIYGYVSGELTKSMMTNAIDQTVESTRE